jgi:hypothetical protein
MADLTNARPIARYGGQDDIFPPIYGPIGIAANLLVYGGAMVGTDASGNMVNADASTCTQVVGVARKNYYNRTTDPSGGAAGAVLGEIIAGVFPFNISTDGGTITNANRWQDLYVVDNQTISLAPQSGGVSRLPAGYLVTVDTLGGPTNGLAWVQVGEPNPYGTPKHLAVSLTLAQIQAQTSGTAFTIVTLPANFWLQNSQIRNTQTFAGGGVSAMTGSLGIAGATTSIIASGISILTSGLINGTPGTNPFPQRGGSAIQLTLTETGGTLATLTAGTITVDLLGTIFL